VFENLRHLADAPQASAASSAANRQAWAGLKAEQERHRQGTGIWDGIKAINRQGVSGYLMREHEASQFKPDPDYVLPKGREEHWTKLGINTGQWELFAKAHSQEHLEYLEHAALENQQDARTLSAFGLWGQLGLGLTDIGALPIDLASGGLGYAAKAGRAVNMVRAGTVAAGVGASFSVASGQYNPEVTLQDHVTAAALSFALGGALNLRKGHLYQDNINPDVVKRAAGINPSADATASEPSGTLSAMRTDPWEAGLGGKTPGAAPLRDTPDWVDDFIQNAERNWQIMPHFATVRRDLAARMGQAKSEVVREAGRILFRDGVGYTDRSIAVKESTGEFAKRHLAVLETQWRRGVNEARDEYFKTNNIRGWDFDARKRFSEEVGRAVRGANDVPPEALKAAKPIRETLQDALNLAKDNDLPGWAEIGSNPNYLPRYWNPQGFQRVFGEMRLYEHQVITGLLRPALRKAWEASGRGLEIDDELLDAVGKAWLKRAQAHFEGDGMGLLIHPLDTDSVSEIRRMLDEAGVSDVQATTLLTKLQRTADETGKLDRAKRRIDLDENFTATLRNARGEDVTLSVSDLLENDVEVVMNRYLREITGWSALSSKAGIKTRAQLDTFVETVKKDAFHAGDKETDIARLMEIGLNSTFGKSTEVKPASRGSRIGRFLRNWNFSRVMNQVGFTMFAELGPVIAHSGLRNVIRSLPEIRAMLKRGRDGTLASKDAQVMEQLFAPGTDFIRNPPFLRLDEDGSVYQPTFSIKGGHHLDNAVNAANHITSIYSGMAPITAILQRVAGRATLLRMMALARKARLDDAEVARLRTWGLDEAGQKQVFDYLKTVRRIEDIDPHALPLETRETLSAFMYRTTRHQVLEGDASDSIEAMHSAAGRIILQFRTFMFNSYTRHFLNSAHHIDDWRTYQMLMLSTAFAGIGWSSRAYLNTIGDKEQRERLLTTENFIKNGVAQSSWAHFIPAVADFAMSDVLHKEPVFQGNRSTGLQNGVMGIPSLDLLNKVMGVPGTFASFLDADEHVTEQQMQDFWRIWMFSNLTGVRNIADAAFEHLPDKPDGTDR